jgi:hypothetical protein
MLKRLSINLAIVSVFLLLFTACNNETNQNGVDVTGTWRAQLAVDSCSPSDLCSSIGFKTGSTANAVMVLSQNGSKVQGTYTYEGTGITADVSGSVAGNQIVLDGSVSQVLGRVTVHLNGTVLNNQMQTTVSHEVSLADGRSGTITGSGNFSRT